MRRSLPFWLPTLLALCLLGRPAAAERVLTVATAS